MKFYRISAVVRRHIYESRHNLDRLTDMIYWPVLDIVMWGFFTIYLAHGSRGQIATGLILSGIMLWGLFRSFQRDFAVGFLAEIWSRNVVNLFSTPLTISEYITGLIIVNLLKALVGLAAAGIIACVFYYYNIFPFIPALFPFMAVLLFFGLTLGVFTTGLIFRFTTRVQSLAYSFAGLLMPLSCVFYPLSALPAPLRAIALTLPSTHALEGMRQVIAGHGFSMSHLLAGLGLDAAYFVISVLFFRWIFESARSRGLLVKLE